MSDIDVRGAVEALRPLVRQAKATNALAEKLESLVGLEDFAKELVTKVEGLKRVVAEAEGKVAAAEAEAVRVCAEAKDKADSVLKDASDAAERCLADAENEAVVIKEEAQEAARQMAEESLAVSQAAASLREEVALLEAKKGSLVTQIADLKSVASRIVG